MDRQLSSRLRTDTLFKWLFKTTGLLVIAVLMGIFLMLAWNSISFLSASSPLDFISGTQWDPGSFKYGIMPLVVSTTMVTFGAMLISVPLGIGTAVFLSEYCPPKVKAVLKPAIEMLAAIPSVAIGFLGIVLLGPEIAFWSDSSNGLNALNGAILLSIMALPTIITVSEDAISAVPQSYREASYGIGADRWQTMRKVVVPAAMPGIVAAVMLGVGRAIGETMTVLMATGNAAAFPTSFFDSIRTMTATIAIEMGEVPYNTTHYFALYAVAAVLFIMTLVVNLTGEYFVNKFRKYHAA